MTLFQCHIFHCPASILIVAYFDAENERQHEKVPNVKTI